MNRYEQISVHRVSALLMFFAWLWAGTLLGQPATINIDHPLSTDVILPGATISIDWDYSSGPVPANVSVSYSVTGGGGGLIGTYPGSTTSTSLIAPTPSSMPADAWIYVQSVDSGHPGSASVKFTIDDPGIHTISIQSPSGGEHWLTGCTYSIRWASSHINSVTVEYEVGGGWLPIASLGPPDPRSYNWTVPSSPTGDATIRVTSIDPPGYTSGPSGTFHIDPAPTITISSPAGGAIVTAGTGAPPYPITWTAGAGVTWVALYYTTDAGVSWQLIAPHVSAGSLTYPWDVPLVPTTHAKVRIADTDSLHPCVSDETPEFTISLAPATLSITNPSSACNWKVGSTHAIQWTSTNIANLTIELSLDGGSTFSPITSGVPAPPGTFSWTVPNSITNDACIKITDPVSAVFFTSAIFIISSPWHAPITIGSNQWNDVSFGDANNGWAVGNYRTIKYTADGGAGWNDPTATMPAPAVIHWTGVSFPDVSHGWIVGTDLSNCFIIKTVDGGSTWTWPSDPTPTIVGFQPRGIAFSDLSHGWVVGTGSPYIFYTADGGTSWNSASTPSDVSALMGVTVWKNSTTGWAVGAFGTDGRILRTSDGVNWITVSSGGSALNDITVTDSIYLWAVGNGGAILGSNNGGVAWSSQPSTTIADLFGVAFASHSLGWAVGAGGTMLQYDLTLFSLGAVKRPNALAGAWHIVPSGTVSDLKTITVFNGIVGCVMGAQGTVLNYALYGPDSIAAITTYAEGWNMVSVPLMVTDGRKTSLFPTATSLAYAYKDGYIMKDTLKNGLGYWLKFDSAQSKILGGSMLNRDTITVSDRWNMIGSIGKPVAVSLIVSDPGGMVTSDYFGYEHAYVKVDTIRPGKAYWVKVIGNGKLILNPSDSSVAKNRIKIIPTAELPPPPPDGESVFDKNVPLSFALYQNFPQPFNPSTTIRYDLPVKANVRLMVFNVLGQRVAKLADEVQEAGYKLKAWDAGNFASGIYFYRLEATSIADPTKTFTQIKKMLLIK